MNEREVVYSVTVRVDEAIAAEWRTWMVDVHIPDVMATGCFEAYEMRQLLQPEETGAITFEIRYLCARMDDYRRYEETHAARLQAEHTARYSGRVQATRRIFGSMERRS